MKIYISHLKNKLYSMKSKASLILLVIFSIILIFPILNDPRYIISDDMRGPEINIDITLSKDINYIWQYSAGLGEPGHINIVDIFPYHVFIFILTKIGFGYVITQKLFITISFVFAGLGMYYLLSILFNGKRPIATFFGALFYITNPFAFAIPYYHFYNIFMLPYIFIPILLGNIINILDNGNKKYYIQSIIIFILNISSLSNPGYIIVEFIPVGFYMIYKLFTDYQRQTTFSRISIYGILFLLINSFWILPFISLMQSNSYSNVENSSIRVATTGFYQRYTEYSTILNNFRLVNWPWYYKVPFTNDFAYRFKNFFEKYSLFDTYLFLPMFVFILATLLNNKNDRNSKFYFFSIFTVVTLFLIKGPAPPFGNIFYDFDKIFPLYTTLFINIYTKYGLHLSLGYSVIMGYFISYFEFKIERLHTKILLIIIMLLILFPMFTPFMLNMIGPQYSYVNIPNSYFESAKIINSYDNNGRILNLPFPILNNFRFYKWGYTGAGLYYNFVDRPIVDKSYTVVSTFNQDSLSNIKYSIEQRDKILFEKLLNIYNIDFIVYNKDDIQYPDKVNDIYMAKNFQAIFSSPEINIYDTKKLDKNNISLKFTSRIYTAQTQITIPHLDSFIQMVKSDIFSSNKVIIVLDQNKNINIPTINSTIHPDVIFQRINPVEYRVKIKKLKEPFYLVFSEAYHPGWKIYIDNEDIRCDPIYSYGNNTECRPQNNFFELKGITKIFEKPIVEEDRHLISNGYANSWLIVPKELAIDKNITITIYFKPQSYFVLGMIISIFTIIVYLYYLAYKKIKKNYLF